MCFTSASSTSASISSPQSAEAPAGLAAAPPAGLAAAAVPESVALVGGAVVDEARGRSTVATSVLDFWPSVGAAFDRFSDRPSAATASGSSKKTSYGTSPSHLRPWASVCSETCRSPSPSAPGPSTTASSSSPATENTAVDEELAVVDGAED